MRSDCRRVDAPEVGPAPIAASRARPRA
jgi:hypothetical protein